MSINHTLDKESEMKKIILILVPVLLMTALYAVDFDISGEFRTRAAIYNDFAENDGGHVDGRFNIGFDSQFHKNLSFRVAAEVGDIVWGNGGGAIGTSEAVEITELNFNYKIDAIDANIIVGQQYWMDRMALVMDDYFSGIMLQKQIGDGISTEFAWMKGVEGIKTAKDDYDVFMAHAQLNQDNPVGMYLFFGNDSDIDYSNLSLMPYVALEMGIASVDATAFMDMQMADDTEMGFGAAVKAKLDMDLFELGLDVLMATEHGLTTISPWYQNGLYIYGIGKHHDGLNLYWGTPYEANAELFTSAVGSLRAPLNENVAAFAAMGYLKDMGFEANAGIEYELIPDLMNMSAYGAFGVHDNEVNNYILGTSMKLEF